MQVITEKYKKITFVAFALLTGTLLVTLLANLAYNGQQKPDSTSKPKVLGAAIKMLPMDEASRRERFQQNFKQSMFSFSTPEEANQELSFKLKYPKLEKLGKPAGVYVSKFGVKEERDAYIYYGDAPLGIQIVAKKYPKKIDFAAWATEADKYKKEGVLKADSTPFLVKVNGYQGYAGEPGYNVVGDDKSPRPGYVSWQEDNGVVYTVYGTYGPNGTPVKELLEIANSLSE